MRQCYLAVAVVLACALCVAAPAKADDISTSIGTQHFVAGTKVLSGPFQTATAGQPAPFNATPNFCGSDLSANCSASWTFHYTIPVGDTITGATLTLGILDIDSKAAGNQVGSFILTGNGGTDDLTSLLNTVSEGLHGSAGSPNSFYEVLTINIPALALADLSGTSASFALTLAGPGLGILGPTTFNGAGLDFSTLDITAMPGTNSVPEPSTWALLLVGIAAVGMKPLLSRQA